MQYAISMNTRDLYGVSRDKIIACGEKTHSGSRAFGFKEGDERYVEVDVKRGDNAEYMTEEEIKAAIESAKDTNRPGAGTTETMHAQSRVLQRSRKPRVCCWLFSSS